MNKTLNNYMYKVGLLFACTFCINLTNKIVYCALLFTFLTLVLNGIAKYHGHKKAAISIVLCTALSLGLFYNKQYFIGGKPINGLILTSLCAILIASYIGLKLFLKLTARYGFAISNCISLCTASLVDHCIMGIFFTTKFPMDKVWVIVYKETGYTYLFGSLVYLSSLAVLYAKPIYIQIKKWLYLLVSVEQAKSKTPLL
ncbi:MAG: hypothetical protein NMK33_05520 [Candidatus Cardinium sp.]|uniref:hypothetical protein n=1 Tax=Cardinium endosymbiont of Dermatophagoides farinae TaxID=2597823 RepID=UPI001184114F|nr:hypothetical protein [Cardinium endosymbiont of Dermatophagoides farinae]TSJ80869.1 hypothetical protein FPG78_02315 [Cardinium endosymbiont of Dermatophagoides farinae]UWW96877.1 MAG: hypothetical protein NMK33_05520 [Candidatus Cardinium sp.]